MEAGGQEDTYVESPQNLNDLQNYLVHFNKEIGVPSGQSALQHNVSQIINHSSQPVFVTVPVSSESTTPDEEQLQVLSTKEETGIMDSGMDPGEETLEDSSPTDQLIQIEEIQDTGGSNQDNQIVTVDASMEGLEHGSVKLQELTLEQIAGGQQGFTVSEGMVMLPMAEAGTILSQTDPRLVQIVTVNGQPTLQLVGDTSIIRQQDTDTVQQGEGIAGGGTVIANVPSVMDGTDPVAVLASVAANTNNVNQLQTIQLAQADTSDTQLVAVRNSADGSQPHLVAVQMDESTPASSDPALQLVSSVENLQLPSSLLLNRASGYQSVAIVPSGDGNQQGEVNYVLIVNQTYDKDNLQGPVYDFGDDIRGEVIEELTEEDGTTKRLVRLNQILAKKTVDGVTAIPVGDQLMCSFCNYTSPKRYLLSRHMKSHSEDRPHKCGLCDRGFKTMASLQNHVNTHTGTRPHKCKLCESAFTTSGELVRHIRYKHTFEKPHKCSKCDYASVELSKLKRHMRSHTGERPYACFHCNYASPDTYKLKRHMRIHTGEKPYECDTCHAKFTQSNSLKAHKLIHTGNKPVFQCTMCPATCGRKTDLKIHMLKLHTSDHPLKCKKCGQSFPDRYTFKVHCKSHEGEKCFKCSECNYAAISQRHLETHMLVHTGLKPYECDDCDLAFRQKQLLKRHRNLYHNPDYTPPDPKDKDHECKECEKAFAHRGNLIRHMHSNHEEDGAGDEYTEMDDTSAGFHTCGGCPKSAVDTVTALTADQLIENSLLADMKEGKLGASPKVVVVHPNGRVEEVTAKLQSLSQSKPVDDFLVSLGVNGDSQFDQVAGIPADICVAGDGSLTSGSEMSISTPVSILNTVVETKLEVADETSSQSLASLPTSATLDQTKEEGTQASFDSDEEDSKKIKILPDFSYEVQSDNSTEVCVDDKSLDTTLPQMIVFPHTSTSIVRKREVHDTDADEGKRIKLETVSTGPD